MSLSGLQDTLEMGEGLETGNWGWGKMAEAMVWMQAVGGWALAAAVKLGLPVAILFGLGLYLHRHHHRGRPAGRGPGVLSGGTRDNPTERNQRARCWEVRRCPPELRLACPAFHRPELPCWQAVKQASGGYIDSRCFQCSLLLSC